MALLIREERLKIKFCSIPDPDLKLLNLEKLNHGEKIKLFLSCLRCEESEPIEKKCDRKKSINSSSMSSSLSTSSSSKTLISFHRCGCLKFVSMAYAPQDFNQKSLINRKNDTFNNNNGINIDMIAATSTAATVDKTSHHMSKKQTKPTNETNGIARPQESRKRTRTRSQTLSENTRKSTTILNKRSRNSIKENSQSIVCVNGDNLSIIDTSNDSSYVSDADNNSLNGLKTIKNKINDQNRLLSEVKQLLSDHCMVCNHTAANHLRLFDVDRLVNESVYLNDCLRLAIDRMTLVQLYSKISEQTSNQIPSAQKRANHALLMMVCSELYQDETFLDFTYQLPPFERPSIKLLIEYWLLTGENKDLFENIGKIFLDELNLWILPQPSSPPASCSNFDALYREFYEFYLVYCLIPRRVPCFARFEFTEIFGLLMLRLIIKPFGHYLMTSSNFNKRHPEFTNQTYNELQTFLNRLELMINQIEKSSLLRKFDENFKNGVIETANFPCVIKSLNVDFLNLINDHSGFQYASFLYNTLKAFNDLNFVVFEPKINENDSCWSVHWLSQPSTSQQKRPFLRKTRKTICSLSSVEPRKKSLVENCCQLDQLSFCDVGLNIFEICSCVKVSHQFYYVVFSWTNNFNDTADQSLQDLFQHALLLQYEKIVESHLPKLGVNYLRAKTRNVQNKSLIVFQRGRVVGGLTFTIRQDKNFSFSDVILLAVDYPFQMKGIGRKMMQLLKDLNRKKVKEIVAYGDLNAQAFFKKQGFEKVPPNEKEEYVSLLQEDFTGAVLIRCKLIERINSTKDNGGSNDTDDYSIDFERLNFNDYFLPNVCSIHKSLPPISNNIEEELKRIVIFHSFLKKNTDLQFMMRVAHKLNENSKTAPINKLDNYEHFNNMIECFKFAQNESSTCSCESKFATHDRFYLLVHRFLREFSIKYSPFEQVEYCFRVENQIRRRFSKLFGKIAKI